MTNNLEAILIASEPKFEFRNPQVIIYGYVKDNEGSAIKYAWINIADLNFTYILNSTQTDAAGYYEIYVEVQEGYRVYVEAEQSAIQDGFTHHYYAPVERRIYIRGELAVQQNFTLEPVGNIILKAYDKNYKLQRQREFLTLHEGLCYTTDTKGITTKSRLHVVWDEWLIAHGWDYNLAVPTFLIPLNEILYITLQWEVQGFGKVLLRANNGSIGYTAYAKGSYVIINLNYELARTKYQTLKLHFDTYLNDGYYFSENLSKLMSLAKSELDNAALRINDSEKAFFSDKSLNYSLWGNEKLELEKAEQSIKRYRKANVTVKVIDKRGRPIRANVTYAQIDHDFLFGFQDMDPFYKDTATLMKDAGLNTAVVTLYWNLIEIVPHVYDWSSVERHMPKKLKNMGFKLKVHPLIYFPPSNLTPEHIRGLGYEDLRNATLELVRRVVTNYTIVDLWEISNEANLKRQQASNITRDQMLQLIKEGIEIVRGYDTNSNISVNIAYPSGEWISYDLSDNYTLPPYEFFELLNTQNIDYDIVGLQYRPGYYDYQGGSKNTNPILDLAELSYMLDFYGSLGKKVHITELQIPSVHLGEMNNYWHRNWDDELQAEYEEGLYRIAYSKPFMEMINWWLILSNYDGDPDPQEADLFDKKHNPKPAYYMLKRLITQEWTTRGNGTTNEKGELFFSGFGGTYNISVSAIEREYESKNVTVHVVEHINNSFIITLNAPPATPSILSGVLEGYPFTPYIYTTSSIDPDDDNIRYTFDWNDGDFFTTGFAQSGWVADASHSWKKPGTYYIRTKATDEEGAVSKWSHPYEVNITTLNLPPHAVTLNYPKNITTDSMELSWSQNTDEDFANYTIYQSIKKDSFGEGIKVIPENKTTSFNVLGLSANTTYYFVVRVYDNERLYNDSNQVSGRTLPLKNYPPKIVSFFPLTNPVIEEGESIRFNLSAVDPDGTIPKIEWKLDGVTVAGGESYIFHANCSSAGYYLVVVEVTDGEFFIEQEWSLTVKEAVINDGIVGNCGGNISFGSLRLEIPKNAIPSPVKVKIGIEEAFVVPPKSYKIFSTPYNISTNITAFEFDKPITIIFSYNETELYNGIVEDNLELWRKEASGWEKLSFALDKDNNTISTKVTYLCSTYVVMVKIPTEESLAMIIKANCLFIVSTTIIATVVAILYFYRKKISG
ncbi:MAG: endo-1,4-beta-xylanase, partial [Candidatus Thermoplasmatota archaeon]